MFIIPHIDYTYTDYIYNNYPKYMIVFKVNYRDYIHKNSFCYLISKDIHFNYNNLKDTFPIYMITKFLYFNVLYKFNLSKLGTDYIINDVPSHFKKECMGSYPNNYIFVVEPLWPLSLENLTDRGPLKRTYQWEEL